MIFNNWLYRLVFLPTHLSIAGASAAAVATVAAGALSAAGSIGAAAMGSKTNKGALKLQRKLMDLQYGIGLQGQQRANQLIGINDQRTGEIYDSAKGVQSILGQNANSLFDQSQNQLKLYQNQYQPAQLMDVADAYGLQWMAPDQQAKYWDNMAAQQKADLAGQYQKALADNGAAVTNFTNKSVADYNAKRDGLKAQLNQLVQDSAATWAPGVKAWDRDAALARINAQENAIQQQLAETPELTSQPIAATSQSAADLQAKTDGLKAQLNQLVQASAATWAPGVKAWDRDAALARITAQENAIQKQLRELTLPTSKPISSLTGANGMTTAQYAATLKAQANNAHTQALRKINAQNAQLKQLSQMGASADNQAAGKANADFQQSAAQSLASARMNDARLGIDPGQATAQFNQLQPALTAQRTNSMNSARFNSMNSRIGQISQVADKGQTALSNYSGLMGQGGNSLVQGQDTLSGAYGSFLQGDANARGWDVLASGSANAGSGAAQALQEQYMNNNRYLANGIGEAAGIASGALSRYAGRSGTSDDEGPGFGTGFGSSGRKITIQIGR